jgi:ADP-ribose pyrophosphatase YjhB (NUDIX family)
MRRELLAIADEIRALATTGLHYTDGPFDRERYEKLLRLAARLAAHGAAGEPDALESLFRAADDGYVTPKLDVRLALFRSESVLLVRERMDGRWSLPGGFVDVGDSPSEAAVREAAEEAGVSTRVDRLAGVFDTRLQPDCPPHLFHIHKLVFVGRLLDPTAEPRAGSEATEAAFHPLASLPDLSLGRTLPLHIREALRVARDPSALPYFD